MVFKQFPYLSFQQSTVFFFFFLSSLSFSSSNVYWSCFLYHFPLIGGVYSYALGVLILKEWPSNGGQLKSDMELGPFLIFFISLLRFCSSHFLVYNGMVWVDRRFLTCFLAGLISVISTSPCHSGRSVVMHIARTHLAWVVVAGSCSANWGVHWLWQASSQTKVVYASFNNICGCFWCLFLLVVNNSWSKLCRA